MTFELMEPAMYIPIALGSSRKFTLLAKDEGGNVPDLRKMADRMVEVVVLGVDPGYVTGRNTSNQVTLDEDTGEATFTIYSPVGATQGQTVLIQVRVDDAVVASHTVMFGDDPGTTPEPMPEGQMMTLATDVLGSYLAAVNTFGVTWTPAADAQQQYVVLASLADGYSVVDVNVLGADASSHEFTVEDAAGDYEIFVATYIDGEFYYDDSTATMVTVE